MLKPNVVLFTREGKKIEILHDSIPIERNWKEFLKRWILLDKFKKKIFSLYRKVNKPR